MAGRGEAGRGEAVLAFRNGERVLVEATHLINLTSGFQLLLREPPPPAAIGQRVRLRGLAEAGGELIDLRLNGEPELAGVAFRNALLGPAEQVSLLALQLPTDLSMQSRVARRKLFGTFDVNGNGFLSLAEVDRGVLQALRTTSLAERKPVIARAFHAAKAACPSRSALGDDFVEEGAEFRLLLLYLRRYFELHLMFAALDTSGDRRLDREEVLAAAPLLQRWGVAAAEADVFDAMDADGHGRVLFDEFAHWALAQHLQLEGVREGSLPSCRAPPPPPPPPPRRTAVPRRPRGEGEGEGKPACRQAVTHRHAAMSPSPRRSMTPRETAARALREARMPAAHRRLRFTLEQALLELDVHLRKVKRLPSAPFIPPPTCPSTPSAPYLHLHAIRAFPHSRRPILAALPHPSLPTSAARLAPSSCVRQGLTPLPSDQIHGHLPHDQTSPSRGLLGALKEHTAAAQRLDALLAAQLHALGEQPPLREVKEGLSLSKGEVRRWQRGLQAHTRAMEAASANLTESRGALQQLCAILSGTASGTVWGGAHVEEKEKGEEGEGEGEEEEEEEAEGGGGWRARDDVALCEQLAAHGFSAWPAVAIAVGATAAACRERWDELLRGQLDAARTRQQEAREATHAAEQALAQTGGDIARVRQQMHAAMQASAASQRQQSSRRRGSGRPLTPLPSPTPPKQRQKHDMPPCPPVPTTYTTTHATTATPPKQRQKHDMPPCPPVPTAYTTTHATTATPPKQRQKHGMPPSILSRSDIPSPVTGCALRRRSAPRWPVSGSELKELKGYPYLVMSTASEQELKHDNVSGSVPVERHAALASLARLVASVGAEPKKVLLSWLWAGGAECAAGVEWWIRSAALEHKVMLILLVSGSLRLKIAGYDCVHSRAK
ncbi:hypothetical protein AB1Y20_012002 [Prymnesium parvum]|uniref:Myb-like domain-containing protein n=1 Tax=Prymnesium parvum TaxID=97485 RepID=A0AB34IPZ3_PRYPA